MVETRITRRTKVDSESKSDVVRVRVTTGLKLVFRDASDRAGLDMSGWLRQLGIREAKKEGLL